MNTDLPEVNFFEDFYMWFDKVEKYEYYATPLYFYKASFNLDYENHLRYVYWKESEGTDEGLKHPATLYFPFQEKLGLLLLRFMNADLSTYETAYRDFFYAYGCEILRDLDDHFKFKLKGRYGNDETYLKEMKRIYDNLKGKLSHIQEELIKAVSYIYNLEENEELKSFTYTERYAVYLIKRKGELYQYNKNDTIIKDSFSNKYDEFHAKDEKEMLKLLKENPMVVSMSDTHKSNDLSSICYAILEEIVNQPNYPIKKCQNCSMYFIPNARLDEIYCDYPKPDGKTCREKGAILTYNKRLQEKTAYSEYRRIYQQKFAQVNKDKSNQKLKAEFEKWKKEAKKRLVKLKHGELGEDEVYEWILNNK